MPDVDFAFLADAAEARPGQKFHVLGGGVSRIGGPEFPVRHPHLSLVVGLLVTDAELGRGHELQFVILGPDGRELSGGGAEIMAQGPPDGRDQIITFSLDFWNLTFPEPGDYSIRILIDGSERKRLPLIVEMRGESPFEVDEVQGGMLPPFPPPTGQA